MFDLASVVAFVKKNPKLVVAFGGPIVKAAIADPKLVPDLVGLTRGGNLGDFVHAHSGLVTAIASAALTQAEAHPELLAEFLEQLLPAGHP
jgi:hypothetical protein